MDPTQKLSKKHATFQMTEIQQLLQLSINHFWQPFVFVKPPRGKRQASCRDAELETMTLTFKGR